MGNQHLKLKNFSLPDTSLPQSKNLAYMKIIPQLNKSIIAQNFKNYLCKTFCLKTMKQVVKGNQNELYQIDSLKILTYNIWFDNFNMENRIHTIMQIIKQSKADIICLQEVTQNFMKILWQNGSKLCENGQYYLPQTKMHWYDTMIISKFPIQFYQIPFRQSGMGRQLLMGGFQITNNKNQKLNFSINCVHLQSLNTEKIRISQLEDINYVNKNFDTVCLLGDMNFSDSYNQDKIIQKQYIDLWNHFNFKDQTKSWTMPKSDKFSAWRPDHILLKFNKSKNQQILKNKHLQAKIQRIGLFTIPPFQHENLHLIQKDGQVRTPSDHMGLITNIRF